MTRSMRCLVSASATGFVLCASLVAPGSASAAQVIAEPSSTRAECPPPRVTGLSALLDAFSTGSAAGPSVLFGAALAALSQPLPEPFGSAQTEFLTQAAQGVQSARTEAPKQIDGLRVAIAPFAAGNDFANQGVDAFADGLDAAATSGGKTIAPGDLTLHQIAVLVRVAREEPPKPC